MDGRLYCHLTNKVSRTGLMTQFSFLARSSHARWAPLRFYLLGVESQPVDIAKKIRKSRTELTFCFKYNKLSVINTSVLLAYLEV